MIDIDTMTETDVRAFLAVTTEDECAWNGHCVEFTGKACDHHRAADRLERFEWERRRTEPGEMPFGSGSSHFSATAADLKEGDVLRYVLPGTGDWATYYVQVIALHRRAGLIVASLRKTNTSGVGRRYEYEPDTRVEISRMGYVR